MEPRYTIGTRFQSTDFLGWIYISNITEDGYHLKLEHVSGSDYFEFISKEKFKLNRMISKYHTFIFN